MKRVLGRSRRGGTLALVLCLYLALGAILADFATTLVDPRVRVQ